MAIEYRVIGAKDWEKLPDLQAENPWAEALTVLERGGTISVGYTDERDLKSKRLSIGKRAHSAGFKVETRFGDGQLAIRRVDDEEFQRRAEVTPAPTPVRSSGKTTIKGTSATAGGRRTRGASAAQVARA
jgi:hypothetical protein